jgi:colanic acid/amylovoran biosynthesis glycosyltransferase
MKLLYITHSGVLASETFLRRTLKYLASEFDTTFVSGARKGDGISGVLIVFSAFNSMSSALTIGTKLISRIPLVSSPGMMWRVRCNYSYRKLRRCKGDFNFALVEYGESGVLALRYLLSKNIKFGVTFHGYDASSLLSDKEYVRRILSVTDAAKFIVVPSKHLRNRLCLQGVDGNKIFIAPCEPDYSKITKIQASDSGGIVVSLGRLTGKKCPIALVYMASIVARHVKDVKFFFAGSGPEMREVVALVNKLNLQDNLVLCGEVSHSEGLALIAKSSVFVQHSVTSKFGDQEGFPVSIAEACAFEKPVVSTFHSGIVEAVRDEVTGLLVQEHDFEAMAHSVIELLQNREMRLKFGLEAGKHIREIAPIEGRNNLLNELIRSNLA